MKRFFAILFNATLTAALMGSPVIAARMSSVNASGPESSSSASDLRPSDPDKELRHLSKNLKLKKDQRADVSIILQERAREIQLLLDIDSLSQEHRNTLAAKVMKDSDAQIVALLRSKQKRRFVEELARSRETH